MLFEFLLPDTTTLLVFVVVFLLLIFYMKARRPENFPPGPEPSFFTGNISIIHKNKFIYKTYAELREKYGPIVGLQYGWYPVVLISDYKLLKEALVDNAHVFSNRPNHLTMIKVLLGNKGFINGHGEIWKETKRLSLRKLRDLGVGKSSMEEKVQVEIKDCLKEIMKKRGEPFQFKNMFSACSCNIISSLLLGKRYEHTDKEFVTLLNSLDDIFKLGGAQNGYFLYLPYITMILFTGLPFAKLAGFDVFKKLQTFIENRIKNHEKDDEDTPDLLDFLHEFKKEKPNHVAFSDKNVFAAIIDLFMAGTETTSTTLRWAFYFMLKYPDVQEKCRQQITDVIGLDRDITLEDRVHLPYVEATLCEIQRLGNITPNAIDHCTSGPVSFHGYSLPDKTIVIPNLYYILMDPEVWPNPEKFKPERFLDEDRHVKPHEFIPFSIGKRACLGENLAKTELFLFFTTLVQRFKFTCAGSLPDESDGEMGITRAPPLYDIIAKPVDM